MYNECKDYKKFGIKQQMVYSGSMNALSNILLPFSCSGEECWGAIIYPFTLPYSIVDLSFNAIADTVALSYTYTIQYSECPKYNISELWEKRTLLEERVRLYYSDQSNPEHLWLLSSDSFKGKKTKDEFIKYLKGNKYMFKNKAGDYTPELTSIARDKAIVRWWNSANVPENIFDQWVYERNNWYLNELNIKNEVRIKKESK